jgi:hypothetical protein
LGQQPAPAASSVAPLEGSPTAGYSVQFSSDRLPLQDQLERYFAKDGEGERGVVSKNLNAFTRKVVSQSQAALDHAWALRRLAERYGSEQMQQSLPRTKWLLQVMIREHLAELTKQVAMTRELLQPVLASIAGDPRGPGRDQQRSLASDPAERDVSVDKDWKDAVLRAFASVEELHRGVLGLFAGASLPVDVDSAQARVRVKTPEEVVETVLDSLPRLEGEIADAHQQVARDFLGGRPVAAKRDPGR